MDDYDDIDIAARMMCGEETGVADLIRAYGGRVRGVLKKIFPEIPDDDRDRALRYAAFKAERAIDTYDERKASLVTWFARIAINVVIDMLKNGKTNYRKDIEAGIDTLEDESVEKPFAEEPASTVDQDQLNDLQAAIEELPDQLRRVVKADLAAGGQANSADLAEELGLAKSTIRQYRKRYKEMLHTLMMKKGHTGTKRRVG